MDQNDDPTERASLSEMLEVAFHSLRDNPAKALELARALRKRAVRLRKREFAASALGLMATASRMLGNDAAWRRYLRLLVRQEPDVWAYQAELGLAEEHFGELEAAASAYRTALSAYRDDEEDFGGIRPAEELKGVIEAALQRIEKGQ